MPVKSVAVRSLLCVLAYLALAQMPARGQVSDLFRSADSPLDVRPLNNVEQDLFLIHGLRLIYTNWPNSSDEKKVAEEIATANKLAMMFRDAATAGGAHMDVIRAYDNCLQLLRDYEAYLGNIGAINRQTLDKAKEGVLEAVGKGFLSGAEDHYFEGASNQDAIAGAAVKILWEIFKKSISLTWERKATMEYEQKRFVERSNAVMVSANATVGRLMRERGWQWGEADLGGAKGESLQDQANRRRRDPFAFYALASAGTNNETPSSVMAKADWCLRAARLVPDGPAYDGFRIIFVSEAVDFGVFSTSLEGTCYSCGPTASAPHALRLARTYLAMRPSDPTGFGHMQLARALAFNRRFGDALEAANAASRQYGREAGFAYRYAKLLSLNYQLDKSVEWLAFAYQLGWQDVSDARTTPDFANLRQGRRQPFEQLTTVKLSPAIRFHPGFFDDILIRNDSPFTLTNVHFKASIQNQGQTYTADVTVKSIAAGATYTATAATLVSGNHYDSYRYSVACDQCE
jgi:hypothetical protein